MAWQFAPIKKLRMWLTAPAPALEGPVGNFLRELSMTAPPAGGGAHGFLDEDGHHRGFVQFFIESNRKVTIHRLWTLKPRAGNGSFMLGKLCELADRHGVEIGLKVLPFGRKPYPISRSHLADWYRRYGFVGTRRKMTRLPLAAAALPTR